MKPLRVGIVCDFVEEGWHSMDLIGDMLMEMLPAVAGGEVEAVQLRPRMRRRCSRLPVIGARAAIADRLAGRLWDYPRWIAPRVRDFDAFHIVDHSYAHLMRVLPAERTIVTCNDLDAIQAALPGAASRLGLLAPGRLLASRVLDGLTRASHVACISEATRSELLATGRIDSNRTSVVRLGVHPGCSPGPVAQWDAEIAARLGPPRFEMLHVGSTIARKRIDVLLEALRGLQHLPGGVRLVRVGGALTPAQRALAQKLGVRDAIVELPFLERPVLAALYRRASVVVLPSDREGFGLPVAEAMACGTPVVASAIPALREVGGDAAIYCPPGDPAAWIASITDLWKELQTGAAGRARRRDACIAAAARFDWARYAAEMTQRYLSTVGRDSSCALHRENA